MSCGARYCSLGSRCAAWRGGSGTGFGGEPAPTLRLANAGIEPYLALFLGAIGVGVLAYPISIFMLRLKEGEFAIGTWVLAELAMLLTTLDPIVNGDTGTSLLQLTSIPAPLRRSITYWAALGSMVALLAVFFMLLRHRLGISIQAIRDDEDAAGSVGVKVMSAKRILFVIGAGGTVVRRFGFNLLPVGYRVRL